MRQIHRQRLVDEVISGLHEFVLSSEATVGSKLPPEAELMEQLGVGRSTLREAVGVLVHLGVLEVRQGDGSYIRTRPANIESLHRRVARASILEVYETRRPLEIEIARLATLRHTPADVASIEGHLSARERAYLQKEWQQYVDADVAFHMALAHAARNPLLADLYEALCPKLAQALVELVTDPVMQQEEDTGPHHHDILQAMANKDPEKAMAAAAANIDTTARQIEGLLLT